MSLPIIPPIPIGSIAVSSVVKVQLKPPLMVTPQSAIDGVFWLGLLRPRTSKGLYRSEFYAIIVSNNSTTRILKFRVPDFRTLNLPSQSVMLFYMLELSYDNILAAQVFHPETSMPPEVVITTLNKDIQIGNAAKFTDVVFIPSSPVLLT